MNDRSSVFRICSMEVSLFSARMWSCLFMTSWPIRRWRCQSSWRTSCTPHKPQWQSVWERGRRLGTRVFGGRIRWLRRSFFRTFSIRSSVHDSIYANRSFRTVFLIANNSPPDNRSCSSNRVQTHWTCVCYFHRFHTPNHDKRENKKTDGEDERD